MIKTYIKGIMLTAHNANYDCRFLLEHVHEEKALMKGRRFFNVDAVYYKQGGEKNWKYESRIATR